MVVHEAITRMIIGAFYEVYNTLGYGFLEKVYENALYIELSRIGLKCEQQKEIRVHYKNQIAGLYYADILVEDMIILELKTAEELHQKHELQLINYLKATNKEIGLLLNFGPKPTFQRKVYSNSNKPTFKSSIILDDDNE